MLLLTRLSNISPRPKGAVLGGRTQSAARLGHPRQGWALLIIGLGIIAWQLRIGFRNLMLSHANQAELDRQASREEALLDREAREHLAELQAQAKEALQRKEAIVLSADLRGELMAAAYQISSRLIWLEGVQEILDELAKDPTNRFISKLSE